MSAGTFRLEPIEVGNEEGCGFSWDHTVADHGNGSWECRECGAEGWDDDDEPGVSQ